MTMMNEEEEEAVPILEERLEYLASRGAMACFPPCGRQDILQVGNAFDLILISSNTTGDVTCNDSVINFPGNNFYKTLNPVMCQGSDSSVQCLLECPQIHGEPIQFPIFNQKIQVPLPNHLEGVAQERIYHDEKEQGTDNNSSSDRDDDDSQHNDDALKTLATLLKTGRNSARYVLTNASGETIGIAPTNIFLWSDRDRVIVSDVDGTITRSNVRGVVDTILTEQYTYCHHGVCEFLSSSSSLPSQTGTVRLLYLTSRPIGIANTTRKFLSQLRQKDTHQLPEGPLIGHSGSLPQVLLMELVYRSIHEFKAAALQQHVVQPFARMGVKKVFLAGFGNTLMDMKVICPC